jgi:hypothetical protein
VSWTNFDSQCLFLIGYWISCIFFYHWSICVLKVAGVALYTVGPEHKLRRIVSSTSVQDLNRAAPATFRTQIEHVWTILSSLKKGSKQNGKFELFLSLSLRNLSSC